jgi:ABC-type branched-subunit amino acid transport system ATPase component
MDTPALVVSDLTKRFGGVTAVDRVTFSVAPGRTVGLIGPNGSGKSTLLNMMSGNLRADGGSVRWGDHELVGRRPHAAAALGVVRTFQDSRLLPDSTVRDTLRVALEVSAHRGAGREILALLIPQRTPVDDMIEQNAARFGVDQWLDTLIAECPSGVRSLVALASVEIGRREDDRSTPRLWLLDEPFSGVDVERAALLGRHLREFASGPNVVVIVDHRISYLRDICDSLVVLNQGALLEQGATQDVLADSKVIAAYLGVEGIL